jgi:hypothetical protein
MTMLFIRGTFVCNNNDDDNNIITSSIKEGNSVRTCLIYNDSPKQSTITIYKHILLLLLLLWAGFTHNDMQPRKPPIIIKHLFPFCMKVFSANHLNSSSIKGILPFSYKLTYVHLLMIIISSSIHAWILRI